MDAPNQTIAVALMLDDRANADDIEDLANVEVFVQHFVRDRLDILDAAVKQETGV